MKKYLTLSLILLSFLSIGAMNVLAGNTSTTPTSTLRPLTAVPTSFFPSGCNSFSDKEWSSMTGENCATSQIHALLSDCPSIYGYSGKTGKPCGGPILPMNPEFCSADGYGITNGYRCGCDFPETGYSTVTGKACHGTVPVKFYAYPGCSRNSGRVSLSTGQDCYDSNPKILLDVKGININPLWGCAGGLTTNFITGEPCSSAPTQTPTTPIPITPAPDTNTPPSKNDGCIAGWAYSSTTGAPCS